MGNIVGEVYVLERVNNKKDSFKVSNIFVVYKNDKGNKLYYNCFAYVEKSKFLKDFRRGDFVRLFRQIRTFVDNDVKEITISYYYLQNYLR